ncbi:unnamed protein product [Clonostachys rhizophaga]|uniref:Uncharacterized protein n=1 Tax=Clonostachys rhizophaga TaxID=160324 RepID=A0A9N9VTC9_9HYPO|nr:unnamed protein product [Clonostachys rhizophaga]
MSATATRRSFLLPELVALIIAAGRDNDRFLYTCLFVNRLFFRESCKLMWQECNTYGVLVNIGHLVQLSKRDEQRAQIYANFIQVLDFDAPEGSDASNLEAEWHGDLACLQFPLLREVIIRRFNHCDAVIRYAQPTLRVFSLWPASQLSDAFLDQLGQQSPRLVNLSLGQSTDSTVTEAGVVRLLRSLRAIRHLTLSPEFDQVWSREAFCAVSKYTHLESLDIPVILDEWIEDLSPIRGFHHLKYLSTNISNDALRLLAPCIPSLVHAHIDFRPPCMSISEVANLKSITDLHLSFPHGSRFSGQALLSISRYCPALEVVTLAEHSDNHPEATGLNDKLVDQIAMHLRNIRILSLNMGTETPLTLRSVRSLSKHCLELRKLVLSSFFISWEEVEGRAEDDVISTRMKSMRLKLHGDQQLLQYNGTQDRVNSEHIDKLARNFLGFFPSLGPIYLGGGGDGERQFMKRFFLARQRLRGINYLSM